MIFFADGNGTIIRSIPSPVFQGAANANTVYLIAPFPAYVKVTVAFQLPNGVWTKPYLMTEQSELSGIVEEVSMKRYSCWTCALSKEITRWYGTATAQFYFYAAQEGVITATSATSFPIGKGVPAVLPDTPDKDVYEEILSNLASIQEQTDNAEYPARSFFEWSSDKTYGMGEYVFYKQIGKFGVLLRSKAPENVSPPFLDSGRIDKDHWELTVDFNQLQRAIVTWRFNDDKCFLSETDWEVI